MIKYFFIFSFIFLSFLKAEDDEFDFGEESVAVDKKIEASALKVTLGLNLAYQYAKPERFQEISPSIFLRYEKQTDYGFVYGEGDSTYNYAHEKEEDSTYVSENYRLKTKLRELYIKSAFGKNTLTFGKQMIVWSKMDFLPSSDFLTSSDLSKSYFAKPEEARIGQVAIAYDYFLSDSHELNIALVLLPEANLIPDGDHPYSQTSGNKLDFEIKDAVDFALRWNYRFDTGSFAASMGEVHGKVAILDFVTANVDTEAYKKHSFVALNLDKIFGSTVFKSELVYLPQKDFQRIESSKPAGSIQKEQYFLGVGLDYNHQDYGSFISEVSFNTRAEDSLLDSSESALFYAFSWSKSFLRDDLDLSVVASFLENFSNSMLRVDTKYKLNDNWYSKAQVSWFEANSENATIQFIKDLDRVDVSLNYSF